MITVFVKAGSSYVGHIAQLTDCFCDNWLAGKKMPCIGIACFIPQCGECACPH